MKPYCFAIHHTFARTVLMADAPDLVSIEWSGGMPVLKVSLLWPILLPAGNINLTTTEPFLVFVLNISMSTH